MAAVTGRGTFVRILGHMVSAELPDDVNRILEYLAMSAKGYSGKMKWNEVAKLKPT
jgi:hypothetical protein